MSMSRKRQYQLLTAHGMYEKPDFTEVESLDYHNARIVFQGTEGAYSQLALREYFGGQTDSYHVETWRDAMEAIKTERQIMRCFRLRILQRASYLKIMT